MSRTFKVGDIVDGRDKSGSKMAKSKPIERIVDNVFYDVGGCFYISMYLTLITPVEALSNNRGVEQYKDQFTKWKPGHLVTIGAETINKLSDLEIDAMSISNCAIRIMMMEQ